MHARARNWIPGDAITDTDSEFKQLACTLGDRNLADYLAHCASKSSGSHVEDSATQLMFAGGHPPGPFSNGTIRRNSPDGGTSPSEFIDRADAFFAPLRRSYLAWTRDHLDADLVDALLARGFTIREPAEGLSGVAVGTRPPVYEIPEGLRLEQVADDAGYLDYLDVIAEVWQLGGAPRSVLESVLFSLDSVRSADMNVFVLYEGDRALSASGNFVSGGCGGMQWTGTRNEARGRGLGQITCAAAWGAAFDRGQSLVVGQASAIGTPVWLKMGFQLVTRYRRFMSPPIARN